MCRISKPEPHRIMKLAGIKVAIQGVAMMPHQCVHLSFVRSDGMCSRMPLLNDKTGILFKYNLISLELTIRKLPDNVLLSFHPHNSFSPALIIEAHIQVFVFTFTFNPPLV